MNLLFILQLAMTLFMTGLIWFVQIVHYPLYGAVGTESFANYETVHCRLTTYVVAPPMVIEALTSILFLGARPSFMTWQESAIGAGLVVIIWLATLFFSIPNHSILSAGFDSSAVSKLITLNWIRTGCWTLRSGLLLFCLYRAINALKITN